MKGEETYERSGQGKSREHFINPSIACSGVFGLLT
jgi:hypothetical protein